jgi:hypothetical protein
MKRPVEVIHGQSSFGGCVVEFCGTCSSLRKEMMTKLSKASVLERQVILHKTQEFK